MQSSQPLSSLLQNKASGVQGLREADGDRGATLEYEGHTGIPLRASLKRSITCVCLCSLPVIRHKHYNPNNPQHSPENLYALQACMGASRTSVKQTDTVDKILPHPKYPLIGSPPRTPAMPCKCVWGPRELQSSLSVPEQSNIEGQIPAGP